ncbi:MAG: GNAT family N-acetyltransferase [Rhodospirillales bacterium]|nr:GNAT family N-acetyltransferase [Rhodospirillales bacterium]
MPERERLNWSPGQPLNLETPRFILRSLVQVDATEQYLGWLRDPEINRYLEARFKDQTLETVKDYIAGRNNRTSFVLGIFVKPNGGHIGNIEATFDANHKTARTGVLIGDTDYWGQKVVLEVRAAILEFLFETLGAHKVWGYCYGDNAAAIYNYRTQGFELEAVLKSHLVGDKGRTDMVHFAMFHDDWLARNKERYR